MAKINRSPDMSDMGGRLVIEYENNFDGQRQEKYLNEFFGDPKIITWKLPAGIERERVEVKTIPLNFGNIHFDGWVNNDPTDASFKLHIDVPDNKSGTIECLMFVKGTGVVNNPGGKIIKYYAGHILGKIIHDNIAWKFPDGAVKQDVTIDLFPKHFATANFKGWVNEDDPKVGDFKLDVDTRTFKDGLVICSIKAQNLLTIPSVLA